MRSFFGPRAGLAEVRHLTARPEYLVLQERGPGLREPHVDHEVGAGPGDYARHRFRCFPRRRPLPADRARHETAGTKGAQNHAGINVDGVRHRVQREFGVCRGFVGIIKAGETGHLTAPGLRVESLDVATFADLQRGIDEHLDETIAAYQRTHLVARRAIRTDQRAYHRAAVTDDLRGHESDPPHVGIPIFPAKTQPLRQIGPYDITIKECDDAPAMVQ